MAHGPFILAAYGITLISLGGFLVATFLRLRRAERAVEDEQG
jgi:heme exporter protein CcmD